MKRKRNKELRVFLTPEERQAIKEKAEKENYKSVSEYVRYLLALDGIKIEE